MPEPRAHGPGSEAEAELRRLVDRDAIVRLHDRLAAVLDAGDYDALAALFTDDGVLEGWSSTPGVEGLWKGAATIGRRMREISTAHQASHRMMTNHRVQLDGDRARSSVAYRSSHLDREPEGPGFRPHSHEGWYVSELVRAAGGWRFARLRHVRLSEVIVTSPEGRATADDVFRAVSDEP